MDSASKKQSVRQSKQSIYETERNKVANQMKEQETNNQSKLFPKSSHEKKQFFPNPFQEFEDRPAYLPQESVVTERSKEMSQQVDELFSFDKPQNHYEKNDALPQSQGIPFEKNALVTEYVEDFEQTDFDEDIQLTAGLDDNLTAKLIFGEENIVLSLSSMRTEREQGIARINAITKFFCDGTADEGIVQEMAKRYAVDIENVLYFLFANVIFFCKGSDHSLQRN
jgi:hypothetical protein